jgi:hypothetical protein
VKKIIIAVLALAIVGAGTAFLFTGKTQFDKISTDKIGAVEEVFLQTTAPAKEVFKPTTAVVTSNTLILYAERSPKSSNLKTLKKGDVIVVTGKDASGWTPAKSGNATGWVLSSSIAVKR